MDEYLQATLVTIDPGAIRLNINLTPGADVAEPVLEAIDLDRDNAISPTEAAAYTELLKRDQSVRLDDHTLELKLTASHLPDPATLRGGSGIIQLELSAVVPRSLAAGTHRLTLENRHGPTASTYLINAARPSSNSVQIIRQIRNKNQSKGEIEFTIGSPAKVPPTNIPVADMSPPTSLLASLSIGVRIAALAVLLLAFFAGVWWMRKSSPRST